MRFLKARQKRQGRRRGLTVSSHASRRKAGKRPSGAARKQPGLLHRILTLFSSRRKARGRRRPPAILSQRQVIRLSLAISLLLLVSGGFWLWQEGWFQRQSEQLAESAYGLTVTAGLKVEDLQVVGRQRTTPESILVATGIERNMPILQLDPVAIRETLEALPWVKQATVSRHLPNVVSVRLVERQPLAIWQEQGQLTLIDQDGRAIPEIDPHLFAELPLVVGPGAPDQAPGLLAMLSSEPVLKERVTAAVWIGGRRWNLQLDGSIDVRLPEADPASAWAQLASVEREHGLLDRDVVTIDLRLPDRLVVRTAPNDEQNGTMESGENT